MADVAKVDGIAIDDIGKINLMDVSPPGGVETITKYACAVIADNATYLPGDSGIFFNGAGAAGASKYCPQYYSDVAGAWGTPNAIIEPGFVGFSAIGDGTNFRIQNESGGAAEYCLMRHYIDSGTYQRVMDENLAASTSYTPAVSGFFADHQCDADISTVVIQIQYTTAGWLTAWEQDVTDRPISLAIGDGTNLRVTNLSGITAHKHATMRAVMTT